MSDIKVVKKCGNRKNIGLGIAIIILFSCHRIKTSYNRTFSLYPKDNKCCCKLYVEVYNVGFLNNLTSHYLTDSINFRIYTGTFYDETGWIHYNCIGDNITIEKIEKINPVFKVDSSIVHGKFVKVPNLNYKLKIVDKKKLNITNLKKNHIFE